MTRKIAIYHRSRIQQVLKKRINKKDIALLKNKNFVIVSNNCWAGAIYKWLERTYNSPFVGLFIYGPCYLKLLSNFNQYMNEKLIFISESKYPDRKVTYPIGLLNDIEIHFTHYKSKEEATIKWEKRTKRMLEEKNLDNYYFEICDRERVCKEQFEEFHNLPYKNKISFSFKHIPSLKNKNHFKIHVSDKNKNQCVPNGKKLFNLTFTPFDLPKWLNS